MTLVLSLANSNFTIQLADRRITPLNAKALPSAVAHENAIKAGALVCGDARMAFGFCGLAFTGTRRRRTFDTRIWLRKALLIAAPPLFQIEALVAALKAIASQEFATNRHIQSVPASDRRLSIMLSGFWNTNAGIVPAGWIITNYQNNFDLGGGGPDSSVPWAEFRCWRWHQSVPLTDSYAHVERLGQWKGIGNNSMIDLRSMLAANRPVDAIVGSALKVMRVASDSHRSSGSIGKEISVVVVPSDLNESISVSSEVNIATKDYFLPDLLVATAPDRCNWTQLELVGKSPRAFAVPRVHPKLPCPCGSGLIYERCHRLFRRDVMGR